jgi:hypothetical protein
MLQLGEVRVGPVLDERPDNIDVAWTNAVSGTHTDTHAQTGVHARTLVDGMVQRRVAAHVARVRVGEPRRQQGGHLRAVAPLGLIHQRRR